MSITATHCMHIFQVISPRRIRLSPKITALMSSNVYQYISVSLRQRKWNHKQSTFVKIKKIVFQLRVKNIKKAKTLNIKKMFRYFFSFPCYFEFLFTVGQIFKSRLLWPRILCFLDWQKYLDWCLRSIILITLSKDQLYLVSKNKFFTFKLSKKRDDCCV